MVRVVLLTFSNEIISPIPAYHAIWQLAFGTSNGRTRNGWSTAITKTNWRSKPGLTQYQATKTQDVK